MDCTIPATHHTLQIDGRTLGYLEWPGSGEPVLLLHGITSSAATLWRIGTELAQAGRRVIALDMPGHGASDPSSAHAIPVIAKIVDAAAIALDLDGYTLIGHSWGGATALTLAAGPYAGHDRIKRVIAIDPLLGLDPARGAETLPNFSVGIGRPASELIPELHTKNPDWHRCDVHWKAQALEQCRLEQVAGLMLESGDWNLLPSVEQITLPLLILVADPQYTIIPADTLVDLRRRIPAHTRIIDIPGATHNMLRGGAYSPTMAAIRDWIT